MPQSDEKSPLNLYPVALDLRGRRCVIVGGGSVAARKAEGLLVVGACVTVIAPELGKSTRAMAAAGRIRYVAERFAPAHLEEAFLVIAATDNAAVNQAVAEAARIQGVLLNQAGASPQGGSDETDHGDLEGDFVTMATVRRGDLLLGVTTGGAGPALAARLRRELETQFGPEWAQYVTLLREMRELAKTRLGDDTTARTAALRRLADADSVRAAFQNADPDGARQEALSCLF